MALKATGTFDVKVNPQSSDADDESAKLGRFTLNKEFQGDLEGTSKGQMLTAGAEVEGSAGYVAIERVTGKLNGRSGSFTLQHIGTMTRGVPDLSVSVVPDTGTGELSGLSGKMSITITEGKHYYDFEYTLS